jgi:succinyl-CoA synthetase alpha subunit
MCYVPGQAACDAAAEAVEAGIELVVMGAEDVPVHDMARLVKLAAGAGAQVIGPNSQGIVLPGIGRIGCPGGSDPWSRFRPGPIGVVSRSGGMASELSMHIAHWGSGTSVQLHIGGSGLLGTTLAEAVRLADADRNTRRIVVFGEMSSQQEVHLADSIADRPTRADLAVVIVGEAMERSTSDVELGHASRVGTVSDGLTVRQKKNALEAARVTVLDSLADLRRWIVRMTFGPPPQKHQSAELDRQVMRAPESSPEDSHPTQAE